MDILADTEKAGKNAQFVYFINLANIYRRMAKKCFRNQLEDDWEHHINNFINELQRGYSTSPMMYPCRKGVNIG